MFITIILLPISTHSVVGQLIICGQAMSHAVNATLRDLVNHWRGDKGKLEFLQDGTLTITFLIVTAKLSKLILNYLIAEKTN